MIGEGAPLRGGAQDSPPGRAGIGRRGGSFLRDLAIGLTQMAPSRIMLVRWAAAPLSLLRMTVGGDGQKNMGGWMMVVSLGAFCSLGA